MEEPQFINPHFNASQVPNSKPSGKSVLLLVLKFALFYSITAALYDWVVFQFLQGPVDPKSGLPVGAGFFVKILLLFVSITLCIKEYRDTYLQGRISLGKAVYMALLVVVLGGALFGIYGVIKLQYWVQIDYDAIFEFFKETTDGMVEEEREFEFYEMARSTIYYMYHPVTVYISSFLFGVIWSLLLGLISGLMLKK